MPDKSDDSLIERMKKLPLWQWGGITIFAGIIANMAVTLMIQAQGMRGAEERGARLGAAIAGGFFIILGIVLIVMHFVRKKK